MKCPACDSHNTVKGYRKTTIVTFAEDEEKAKQKQHKRRTEAWACSDCGATWRDRRKVD